MDVSAIELFDPATDQPVICLTKSQKPFTLSADSITTASWTFRVPETTNLIGCRIVADSESGSDGEQHLIPVLSNQILVTESTPFYLMENGEKRIRLSGKNGTDSRNPFRMTLELTGNQSGMPYRLCLRLPNRQMTMSFPGSPLIIATRWLIISQQPIRASRK